MITLPLTNEAVIVHMLNAQNADLTERCNHLRAEMERLQHEVNFLEQGVLACLLLSLLAVVGLVLRSERDRRNRLLNMSANMENNTSSK